MSYTTNLRLARDILKRNSDLGTFDVDPMDQQQCLDLIAAFQELGCTVERPGRGTKLVVTVPDHIDGPQK